MALKKVYLFDENMNKVEGVAAKVSETQPTGNEEVWIKKGKNLINPKKQILKLKDFLF